MNLPSILLLIHQHGLLTTSSWPVEVSEAWPRPWRLRGVVAHSKSGPLRFPSRVVVDATGDADVAALSGAPLHIAEHSKHSLCFRLGNVDVDAFVSHFRDVPEEYPAPMDVNWALDEALAQYEACGTWRWPFPR